MSGVNSSRSKDLPDNKALALVVRALYLVRGSFLAFVFACGVLMLLAAVVLQNGLMAGLLGIWGGSAILYAIAGKLLLGLFGYT